MYHLLVIYRWHINYTHRVVGCLVNLVKLAEWSTQKHNDFNRNATAVRVAETNWSTNRMNVEHIDTEVVGRQIQLIKYLYHNSNLTQLLVIWFNVGRNVILITA